MPRRMDDEDPGSRLGSRKLKEKIEAYWATRSDDFFKPYVSIEANMGALGRHDVRSDMVNGWPQKRKEIKDEGN
jgi:hypothetical protein